MDLLDPRTIHKEHVHPGASLYLKVALILFVLTALEVGAYELSRREGATGLVATVGTLLIPILIILSAAKFALVAMFYMHLKQDAKIYSGLFVFPLVIAIVIVFALIALFSVVQLMA